MKSSKRGFTLIELIIVIAIIAVVAGFIFPLITSSIVPPESAARDFAGKLYNVQPQSVTAVCKRLERRCTIYFRDSDNRAIEKDIECDYRGDCAPVRYPLMR